MLLWYSHLLHACVLHIHNGGSLWMAIYRILIGHLSDTQDWLFFIEHDICMCIEMYLTVIGTHNIFLLLTKLYIYIYIYIYICVCVCVCAMSDYEYAYNIWVHVYCAIGRCLHLLYFVHIICVITAYYCCLPCSYSSFIIDILVCLVFWLFCQSTSEYLYPSVHLFYHLHFLDDLVISPFFSFLSHTISLCRVFLLFVLTVQSLLISDQLCFIFHVGCIHLLPGLTKCQIFIILGFIFKLS